MGYELKFFPADSKLWDMFSWNVDGIMQAERVIGPSLRIMGVIKSQEDMHKITVNFLKEYRVLSDIISDISLSQQEKDDLLGKQMGKIMKKFPYLFNGKEKHG